MDTLLDVKFLAYLAGIGTIVFLGAGVKVPLDRATSNIRPTKPDNIQNNEWKLGEEPSGGEYIGFYERFVFLTALLVGHPEFISVWLAFKLGAKWETWSHIVNFSKENIDLVIRRKFASWILARFLIGTLLNIIVAFIGMYVSYCVNKLY